MKTEPGLRAEDARLDGLIEELVWTASRYGTYKARGPVEDEVAASEAMDAARDALHEYIAEIRVPGPTDAALERAGQMVLA